jgi:hypothetical protein
MADDDHHEEEAQHKGHTIKVSTTRGPKGRWWWRYLIDGRTQGNGLVPCPDAETALRQGMNAARARVDGM